MKFCLMLVGFLFVFKYLLYVNSSVTEFAAFNFAKNTFFIVLEFLLMLVS